MFKQGLLSFVDSVNIITQHFWALLCFIERARRYILHSPFFYIVLGLNLLEEENFCVGPQGEGGGQEEPIILHSRSDCRAPEYWGGRNEPNRPNPCHHGAPLQAGASAESKLVPSNKWGKACHPEPSGEGQHLDRPPLLSVPLSARASNSNFTRPHLGRTWGREQLDWIHSLVTPKKIVLNWGEGVYTQEKTVVSIKSMNWKVLIFPL